ncbi:ATP-binding cassette domain-containing protein [Desulfosporosinus sp. FKA]|uniref:ABC transporter ATP-binding protein n=1 Tax=Desulfosporosinus sp. FKA TaxID=1969834 RepID=UPI000B49EF01|nr:ATP-binding cassette domain-containing protein [Desulfosporosinus sp. FKA]
MNSAKVLELQNLYYGDILKGVTMNWRKGEILALMGLNGAGKSTLARLLAGLIAPNKGEIRLQENGRILPWEAVERWREIGFIGQHPRRQTIGATVAEELGFGLINLGMDQKTVRYHVSQLTREIGLQGKENQSPATLSGGQRQRLVTAAILALQPSFLILDEALSMLDAKAQDSILELLRKARTTTGQLWITHDSELARQADRLLVLHDGSLVDWGNPRDAFERHYAELSIFEAKQQSHEFSELKAGPRKEDQRRILVWEEADFNSRLKINKSIKPGEFLAIVGPSGAGKTTILESVYGFTLAAKGQLLVNGEVMNKHNSGDLRRKMGFVLQEAGEYLIGRSVSEEIFYHQQRTAAKSPSAEQELYLNRYGIPAHLARVAPERLSGGERQKVALAAAMKTLPEILLLDEPLLGLDAKSRESIQRLIFSLREITILFVTHDLRDVLGAADRIWLVENGEIVLDCLVEEWGNYRDEFIRSGVHC